VFRSGFLACSEHEQLHAAIIQQRAPHTHTHRELLTCKQECSQGFWGWQARVHGEGGLTHASLPSLCDPCNRPCSLSLSFSASVFLYNFFFLFSLSFSAVRSNMVGSFALTALSSWAVAASSTTATSKLTFAQKRQPNPCPEPRKQRTAISAHFAPQLRLH